MADTDTTTPHRPREGDTPSADQPPTKRQKLGDDQNLTTSEVVKTPLLPPSHALLEITRGGEPDGDGFTQMLETDVGISEYVGWDIPPIQAVIKQRCVQHINGFRRDLHLVSQVHGLSGLRDRPTQQSDPFKVTRASRVFFHTRPFKQCSTPREHFPTSSPACARSNTSPGGLRAYAHTR